MITRTITAFTALSLVAACGGSGDGGSPKTPGQADSNERGAPSAMAALSSNWDVSHGAAIAAATSRADFGSVTQSSNSNGSDITTDIASTSFNGNTLQLAIRRQDGSRIVLDTADDADGSNAFPTPLSGADGRTYGLLDFTATSISAASVTVSWNKSDPSDYLAGGYWMHFEGSVEPLSIESAEFGAFVDGPELSEAATLPDLGTARYNGRAGGLYTVHYGPHFVKPAPGSRETGEFEGDMTLMADFGSGTISGCVGCDGPLMTDYILIDGNTGQSRRVFDEGIELRIHLDSAEISGSGQFTGMTIRVSHPHPDVTFNRTEGSWAGQFSSKTDNGVPRLVAGTFGAQSESTGNTKVALVGAWYGVK